MSDQFIYAVRDSKGFRLRRGLNSEDPIIFEGTQTPRDNACRVMAFSNNGAYFCFNDMKRTVLVDTVSGKILFELALVRTSQICFSPKDTVLVTYEPYAVYGKQKEEDEAAQEGGKKRQPQPNLGVWSVPDGKPLARLIAQKQVCWRPQWTDDERFCARLLGSELLFHQNSNFEKYDLKLVISKMSTYAVASGPPPYHVAGYVPAAKGQPAIVHVRSLNESFAVIANKTFWKCDRVNFFWNCKGNALIVLAILDVDTTNQSYYGEQNLYLIQTNCSSSMVPLAKNGPVYSVKWNPNGREFAACYGFMPAKVSLYNLNGEVTFDFGIGPRNDVHYNRFGSVLLICGFGNLSAGHMEFWSVEHRKQIVKIQVPNTTLFEWGPDGQHFVTATTTPRLRIDNNYRFWRLTGELLSEVQYSAEEELWQVQWRPAAEGVYGDFPVVPLTSEQKAKSGLRTTTNSGTAQHPIDNLPKGTVSSQGAYVPPHLRNKTNAGKNSSSNGQRGTSGTAVISDTERKRRTLQKKIKDIANLKERRDKGETLEVNQVAKIEKEMELIAELEKLYLD